MIVFFIIFFMFLDGLDLSELLYILGCGKVIGDWLLRFEGLVIGFIGIDSGFLVWVDDVVVGFLLFVCFLERLY